MISRMGVAQQSQRVRNVAQKLADAQADLAALPVPQQYNALSLAEKLRNISHSMAAAAELGAKTAHRMHALANDQAAKIDDTMPLADRDALQGVAALIKLGNDAGALPRDLIAASKEAVAKATAPEVAAEDAAPVRPSVSRDQWLQHHGIA
jgi:hypothetical protein